MKEAVELVNNTSQHIFITGKAGTGKTTLLRHIIKTCSKKLVVTAPTGVAAINAGGMTLHSMFGIPPDPYAPGGGLKKNLSEGRSRLLAAIDVLIIDEAGMVRADIIDYIDKRLRVVRGSNDPFGGVQLVMFGDLYQLPPVVRREDMVVLKPYYRSVLFFNAIAFKNDGIRVVELDKVFRQTEIKFTDMLNRVRVYDVDRELLVDLEELRSIGKSRDFDSGRVHLCSLRKEADSINREMLGEATFSNAVSIKDVFPDSSIPCDKLLKLRIGARVMTTVNRKAERKGDCVVPGYYNGSLGYVIGLDASKGYITVRLDDGNTVRVEPYTWENVEYRLENNEVVRNVLGTCIQYPLTLAWAMTIHKSQGLSFDKVAVHSRHSFCPGLIYVALSRCRTLEGISTDFFITPGHIIPNNEILAFDEAVRMGDGVFRFLNYQNCLK